MGSKDSSNKAVTSATTWSYMLHPVPRAALAFHGVGQLGSPHGPRRPTALDTLQEQACPNTNINSIVEYLEEQAANTAINTAINTNSVPVTVPARGTPVGRSVNEHSGRLLLHSGPISNNDRMSDTPAATTSTSTNAAGSPKTAMMGSPFAGPYGLGISIQLPAASGESSKAPAYGKASSSSTAAATPTRPWTAEEDDSLRGVMRTTPGRSWPEISKRAFPKGERNKHECCARWRILSTPKATKGPWTSDEDNQLLDLVDEFGPEKWVIIATKLQTRSGKQCRERWHNHLDPAIKKTPFTAEEDETIWRLYSQWGSKWAEIAKHLPGRPDNMIKNHFNTSVQRNKRKQRTRAHAEAEGSSSAQDGEDYNLPGIGLGHSGMKEGSFGDEDPSSSTSASFVDSHGNPVESAGIPAGGGLSSSSGSATTYIKVAKDRYLPYRRPLPRPSLLHNQHSSSSSSGGLGSPSLHSPNTPLSPYLSMPTPNSATTSATSPISFSSSNSNTTSYIRQPLSASLPPSASSSQAGFVIRHVGPPGSAGGYSHHPHGSFRYPPSRGYSDNTSPATTPQEFSPPLPGSPHYSAYPQYSHARTQPGGPSPPSSGVTFGYARNNINSHYQAYYPNSPISSSYTQHLPIPGSGNSGGSSAPMSLSRSLPAQLSNPNSPAMHPGAPSPAMSESALVKNEHVSAAVSPAMSPLASKAEDGGEGQSYFQQQHQKVQYFPVVHQPEPESRQQSPNTQYSPQMEGVASHPVSPAINQEEITGEEKEVARITFRRIPGTTNQSNEAAAIMEYDNEQTYVIPGSARSIPSPRSPASIAQEQQQPHLSPLLPTIVTNRGSIGGGGGNNPRPQFLHAATTSFLSPSTERLSIHTSIPSPTLSPHLSSVPPASAPPTTTSMVGGPASNSPAEHSMSPQLHHHHHPHSPYYYTHQQQQQGFPDVSPENMHRSEMQQQQQQAVASMPVWQPRHHSPLLEMQRALPSPLSITANYEDEQRPDAGVQFPLPDRDSDKSFGEQPPRSPYVAPASTLMSASTSTNTIASTGTTAVELSSPASSSLVTPPQQHEERLASIHMQYESHDLEDGALEAAYKDGYEDLKDQPNWQNERRSEEEFGQQSPDMHQGRFKEISDTYDEDMQ